MLWRIFGCQGEEIIGEWRKLHDKKNTLYLEGKAE
jgi:hypothetical protein